MSTINCSIGDKESTRFVTCPLFILFSFNKFLLLILFFDKNWGEKMKKRNKEEVSSQIIST